MSGHLAIRPAGPPVLSVLMVTHGALDWVRRSVTALVLNTPPAFELVVVDNASPDGTVAWLRSSVPDAKVIELDRNVGFGAANNLAAAHASGRYLCLLNSDAIVPPGWHEPLVETLESHPDAGAVVPLYLNEDGTVQEAGCAVEPDGRVVAIGVGDDPDRAEYTFARPVQYGSAACLLTRRATFGRLRGFDVNYGVAYYEDVDLAFRMRARGRRTWLQPAVRVTHGRGASSPTPEEAVARREANRERFRSVWCDALSGRPVMVDLEREPHRLVSARDFEVPDRLLVLTEQEHGPALATAREILRAAPAARVTLALARNHDDPEGTPADLEVAAVPVPRGAADPVRDRAWRDWLEARRFHYSAVYAAPPLLERLAPSLDDTQPQALRRPLAAAG